ncbi:MAG: glycosyltransferase family protein [Bacteroidales bacterium]|nr:glycosyltransferase family protein [Bacteroidales bacterium]
MKILAITQARYGSTRLPAKILKEIDGQTLLEIHLRRILRSSLVSKLKIATTDEEGSRYIIDVARKVGVEYFQGSVDDVLKRFYDTALEERPDYVVRLTSDCPLIDPEVIDGVIRYTLAHDCDYVSTDPQSYPDGLDTEVFRFEALERAYKEAKLTSEREHVTPYIWKNGTAKGGNMFKTHYVRCPEGDFSSYRITIDTPEDFELISALVRAEGTSLGWKQYADYLAGHGEVFALNSMYERNEGYAESVKNDKKIE